MDYMAASRARELSEKFADQMVAELNAFNEQYPEPVMSGEEEEYLRRRESKDAVSTFPTPEQFRRNFEILYCRYLASKLVIGPE